jgi:hypothetical protein
MHAPGPRSFSAAQRNTCRNRETQPLIVLRQMPFPIIASRQTFSASGPKSAAGTSP